MKKTVLLAGGGKVGYYLALTLKKNGYAIGLIEADRERAARIAEELGITVIVGDATEPETLEDAKAEKAGYVVALTGSDEANLAVCQMAKTGFGVPETIARVSNPGNEEIFKRLGVDATISTTALAAATIEKALPTNGLRLSPIFGQGDVELAEAEIQENSPVAGKAVAEAELPEDCLLIAVLRGGKVSFPRGRTVFQKGDRIYALARRATAGQLRSALLGGNK